MLIHSFLSRLTVFHQVLHKVRYQLLLGSLLCVFVLNIVFPSNIYGGIAQLLYLPFQLLAALALLTVCAWLGNIGRNNKMFYIPMVFMMIVTIWSLFQTVTNRIGQITSDNPEVLAKVDWGTYAQAILGALLIVLALFLAWEGIQTIFFKKNKKA